MEPANAGDDALDNEIRRTRRLEVDELRGADVVSTVTDVERDIVQSLVPGTDTVVLPTVHAVRPASVPGPDERADLLFIGSYQHTPNVDAVQWFSSTVLPIVRRQRSTRLIALGASPPEELRALDSDAVTVPGYIPDVTGFFDGARMFVAPIRYGAGMKGKIGMSMAMGLPVVTTSMGAEGMGLVDGTHALVAEDDQSFADAILRLYDDDELWLTLSEEGRQMVTREWSPEAMKGRLADLMTRTRSAGSMRARTWGLLDPEGPMGPAPTPTGH